MKIGGNQLAFTTEAPTRDRQPMLGEVRNIATIRCMLGEVGNIATIHCYEK